jgi:hypothetical protein
VHGGLGPEVHEALDVAGARAEAGAPEQPLGLAATPAGVLEDGVGDRARGGVGAGPGPGAAAGAGAGPAFGATTTGAVAGGEAMWIGGAAGVGTGSPAAGLGTGAAAGGRVVR